MQSFFSKLLLLPLMLSVSACGFFEKDNTREPSALVSFSPQVKVQALWSASTGASTKGEYLKLNPAMSEESIFTAGTRGLVTEVNKESGHINWQIQTCLVYLEGPGVGEGIVVVGGSKGEVIALEQINGAERWKIKVHGEVLAAPAVASGMVYIKTVDGHVRALSARDGSQQWLFQQAEPNLILRGASTPLAYQHSVVTGFANGNIAKLSMDRGQLQWLQSIAVPEGAFAIERMIDIDANPIVFEGHLYAATYQGKVAALDWATSRIRWSHQLSSYTGMVADSSALYISDARGHIFAFDATSGAIKWEQRQLAYRLLSGPAILDRYVVVGDAEGFLHWLNKTDGSTAARIGTGNAVYAAPITDKNKLYVLTNEGKLAAYTLTPLTH